jgi:hypothetical protein
MADEGLKLYNPHDGLTGRDGGPYLDQVEREAAEIRRAKIENREPDLENPPAVAGTPLVTGAQLAAIANPASNPSQQGNDVLAQAVDNIATNDDFAVKSVAEVPAGTLTGVENVTPENANEDPTNPTGAASWPVQSPNLDMTEKTESDNTPDPAASNEQGASNDTPIFAQAEAETASNKGTE